MHIECTCEHVNMPENAPSGHKMHIPGLNILTSV